nr:MAG TPA: hypothetical protein [Caudoviricetes sp.]
MGSSPVTRMIKLIYHKAFNFFVAALWYSYLQS